ncbi:MAG TPA: hypothetical protein VHM24_06070, partial [Gemmatimonadaceae bacterium]|nr:hypothetical protein [Gemmatimonadaceae bacterium]
ESEPSAETKNLIGLVRSRTRPHPGKSVELDSVRDSPAAILEPAAGGRAAASDEAHPARGSREKAADPGTRHRFSRVGVAALATAVLATAGYGWLKKGDAKAGQPVPTIAVGSVVESGPGADSSGQSGTVREILATDLARIEGLNVVSQSRMYDVLAHISKRADSPGALAEAARIAGAGEIIEGTLYRRDGVGPPLRVDIRRVNLATGVMVSAHSASGSDLFALVDSVTFHLAAALRLEAPDHALSAATSKSLVARRLYDEGLRLHYEGNGPGATRFFKAALKEDSTFGMAAYYAAMDPAGPDYERATRLLSLASRNATRAPLRERLTVRHAWAWMTNDPVARTIAESLAVNFPAEPEGAMALGNSLQLAGEFLAAIPLFERAFALDSAQFSRAPGGGACRPCGALTAIMNSYTLADSAAAVERSARRLIRFQRRSPAALLRLADLYATAGRRRESQALVDSAAGIDPGAIRALNMDIRIAFRAGDFNEAERRIRHRLSDVDPEMRTDGLWWLIILERTRGRLIAADSIAREFCATVASGPSSYASGWREGWCLLARGPVLFELGRFAESAQNYEKLAQVRRMFPSLVEHAPSMLARHHAWIRGHALNAYVYAGDVNAASRLADTVEHWGKLSAYGRDRRLHFHGRGLLAARQGRRDEAISHFRKAMFSPSEGYTRTNLELARELIAAGRNSEAIAVLRPALAGPIESSNLYVTLTEIHEQMAIAFERRAARDSAAVHYAWVARAWRDADRRFRERYDIAKKKSAIAGL